MTALEQLHAQIALEAQLWDERADEYFRNARYEIAYVALYYEPFRKAYFGWFTSWDSTDGTQFLSRQG